MSARQILILVLGACLSLAVGLALAFQNNITKFNLSPRTPYQTYTPPPPPAYEARGAWAIWPGDAEAGDADIFYVHSTTYSARGNWNARISAASADTTLRRVAAPNEAGPFAPVGALYGPRYRQATLYASFRTTYDARAAHELAYGDVERAFEHFLSERKSDRPIILVGYGQGGLHVLGLLQYQFATNDDLRSRLAAAYVIGYATPKALFDDPLQSVPPCASISDIRCVIAYTDLESGFEDEKRRHRAWALVWSAGKRLTSLRGQPHLCINPLIWRETDEPADRQYHVGAASATGLGLEDPPPAISKAVDAQCENGVLSVTKPRQNFLRRRHWFGAHWRPQDFNLFFHDLTVDARRRAENLSAILEEEAQYLVPINETVDLEISPVKKVPN